MPKGVKFEWTPRRRKIALDMLNNGSTEREIAQVLGCAHGTVGRFFNSPAKKE